MLKLMSDLIFKKSCSGTTFFRLDFLNYEKKTTIKQSIGSKKDRRESGLFYLKVNYFVFSASLKSFPATNFG